MTNEERRRQHLLYIWVFLLLDVIYGEQGGMIDGLLLYCS